MSRVRAFLVFLYDFVVGDDWRMSVAVVLGLGATVVLVGAGATGVWWVLPVFVAAGLAISLRRAVRREPAG